MLPEQQQRIMGYFIEEAKDHLNTIEQGLLSLQSTIENPDKANEIFRAAHSVKGGAAMLGLESIQKTAHRMEDYFKVLKEATVQVDHSLETMFLRISDGLKDLLEQLEGPFGLTQEKAQEIMAGIDPVFGQLETHLNKLVAQSGTGTANSADSTSSALQTSFKQDVAALLRELLSAFKQPDTAESRKSIQESCVQLISIGEQFKLATWCDLIETARMVSANQSNEYRALAPIVIKEIKKAQDLVLADRASEISVSDAMQALLPEDILSTSDSPDAELPELSDSIIETNSDEESLFETDSLFEDDSLAEEDTSDEFLEDNNLFEGNLFDEASSVPEENNDFDDLFSPEIAIDEEIDISSITENDEATAEAAELEIDLSDTESTEEAPIERLNIDLDFNEIPSELSALNRNSEREEKADESLDALLATVNVTGPDVGADELNSLADLFDGDLEELDNTLGGHPFVSEEMRLHPEKIDLNEEDDLTDLLGSEITDGVAQEDHNSEDDIDDDLFGGTLTNEGFATDSELDLEFNDSVDESELTPESQTVDSTTTSQLTDETEDVWGSDDDAALFGVPTDQLFSIEDTDLEVEAADHTATSSDTTEQAEQAQPEESTKEDIELASLEFDEDLGQEEQSSKGTPAVSLFSDEHISPSEDEIEFPTLTGIELEEAEKDIDSFFFDTDEGEMLSEQEEQIESETANEELSELLSEEAPAAEGSAENISQMSDDPWGELSLETEQISTEESSVDEAVDDLFSEESAEPIETATTDSDVLSENLEEDFLTADSNLVFGESSESTHSDLGDLLSEAEDIDIASNNSSDEESDDLWGDLTEADTTEQSEPAISLEDFSAVAESLPAEEAEALSSFDELESDVTLEDETQFSDSFIDFENAENSALFETVSDGLSIEEPELDEAITTFSNLLPSEIDAFVENKAAINETEQASQDDLLGTDIFETEEPVAEESQSESSIEALEQQTDEGSEDSFEDLLGEDLFGESDAVQIDVQAAEASTEEVANDISSDEFLSLDFEGSDVEIDISKEFEPEAFESESSESESSESEEFESDFDSLDDLLSAGSLEGEVNEPEEAMPNSFDDLDSLLEDDSTPNESLSPSVEDTQHERGDSADAAISAAEGSLDDEDFGDLERLLDDGDSEQKTPTVSRRVAPGPARRGNSSIREQNMRVPVKHLDNLSNLVGELVVSRNTLESDQERLRQFLDNLLFQVQQLNDVGQRMRDLYERSLLESSLLSNRRAHVLAQGTQPVAESEGHATGATFDALEMDRFTGFHTLSQEMIELIVRVRESSSDIGYTVESSDQVTRQFRQITTQLQEGLNTARMVAFSQAADRLPRAVRDISLKCGKQAKLVIEGKDTLIDKMIVEHLYDPLTHLVNNAITHGIETPEARQAAGKSPEGIITIQAFYQGNQTVIYVADDGGGINPDFVKRKAIEKNLITQSEADALSDIEAYALIFHAGFSTRDQADDFAGRGVGMDVVQTSLAEIRGAITIDSELGKGTSFTIRLPLTLSISKALSCVSNQARIAFPMDGVEDMLDVPRARVVKNDNGQDCIRWRDGLLPFQTVTELLKFNRTLGRGRVYGGSQDDDVLSIIVLRSANTFVALQVDQVIGEEEIVIKQLEGPVPKPLGIAGATILGDGRVMPIADVLELIDIAMGRVRREPSSMLWAETPVEEAPVKTDPTVLIVDDSITVRELLSMSFNKVGYRVEQARDGQEAWDKLRSGLPCDLVFCDIEMPRMDGLELLSRMQKDGQLKRVPIAMLTSRGADRHRQMAVDLGASGYFTKPYLEEALLDAAQRMLNGESLTKGRGG